MQISVGAPPSSEYVAKYLKSGPKKLWEPTPLAIPVCSELHQVSLFVAKLVSVNKSKNTEKFVHAKDSAEKGPEMVSREPTPLVMSPAGSVHQPAESSQKGPVKVREPTPQEIGVLKNDESANTGAKQGPVCGNREPTPPSRKF